MEITMRKRSKAILCSVIASLEIIGAGSFGTIYSYAADAENTADSAGSGTVSEQAANETAGWFTDESGRIYYYTDDGSAVTGIKEIDGQKYLFASNGVLKTGWRTIDGKRYYFDHETGKPVYGWIEYGGNKYYVSAGIGKVSGYLADVDGSCYIFDEDGIMCKGIGFVNLDGSFYYVGEDGKLLTEAAVIDGIPYIFSYNGRLKTGWRTYNGKRYYYNAETGEAELGLFYYEGSYYYITAEDGKLTGAVNIDGIDYLFNSVYGCMELGWQTVNDAVHYYYDDGTAATGLQTIDGDRYYFGSDGKMLTGWQTVDGKKYYFGADGKMASGWQTIDGSRYYFGSDGLAVTGLQTVGGSKYYFGSDGKMLTGWQTADGKKYYFGSDGKMVSGWQTIDGSRYYFGSDGQAAAGRNSIDGKTYIFSADGKMLTGWQTADGVKYYLGSDGAAVTGWQNIGGGRYCFSSDGKMLTGWQTIDGKMYHFDSASGIMSVSTVIDGYTIGPDGVAVRISAVQLRANDVIASIGTDAQNIFNYVRSHNKYKYIEETKPLAQIESIGWSYFANYAMDNRFVVCYYFAAVTDVLFRQAGFETRIVYGTGRGDGDHYWNQVRINGVWTNYDTCNGYANVTDDYLKLQNYTWYKYVYPVYN